MISKKKTNSKPTRGSRTKTTKAKAAKKTAGVGGGMDMRKLDKNKKKRSTA